MGTQTVIVRYNHNLVIMAGKVLPKGDVKRAIVLYETTEGGGGGVVSRDHTTSQKCFRSVNSSSVLSFESFLLVSNPNYIVFARALSYRAQGTSLLKQSCSHV